MIKGSVFFALLLTLLSHQLLAQFITTWKTDIPSTSNDNQITIPTTGTGYNYDIDWGDGSSDTGVTGNITHIYSVPDTYTVSITGDFPRIYFNNLGDKEKLIAINQWGNISWSSMNKAFSGCINLTIPATDAPDLSLVTDMSYMFENATSFNQPINHWDVSNITNMSNLFAVAKSFNQPLDNWDVSNVTDMSAMFLSFMGSNAFNQPINNWDVSSVTDMHNMFQEATLFDQPLNSWDVSKVENMNFMFSDAYSFNQPLDMWDVSSVTTMMGMFSNASSYNQPLNSWNVSSVIKMPGMFSGAKSFNQPLDNWDVSNVTNMNNMFAVTYNFDQDLSSWNVSNVEDMSSMFALAYTFNQSLSTWDVSKVTNMYFMFSNANKFNQPLDAWNVSNVTDMNYMLSNTNISGENYDMTLEAWSNILTLQNGITLGADGLYYCQGEIARQKLIDDFGWTFVGDSKQCYDNVPFITTWKTDNPGTTNDNQIRIPTSGTGYNYKVDWGDGNTDVGIKGDITHTYMSPGIYTVSITGDFPRIFFNWSYDKYKILTVEQWGGIQWTSMASAFMACANLTIPATDAPDLSLVTDMSYMFAWCTTINSSIDHWDVSNVQNMSGMFNGSSSFNQPLDNWDVSSVVTMNSMFEDASSFDQSLETWSIDKVTNMSFMLSNSKLSTQNYEATIIAWASLVSIQNDVPLGATGLTYCISESARQKLINENGWIIEGDERQCIESTSYEFAIDENSSNGTVAGEFLNINTAGNELFYSIDGGSDVFSIDNNTKTLKVKDKDVLNYEKTSEFSYTLIVTDSIEYKNSELLIHILDVNESPEVNNLEFTISESAQNGLIVGNIGVTDPENNVLTYTIVSGNEDNVFALNNNDLIVNDSSLLDFESNPTIELQIEVSDGLLTSIYAILISLEDANEQPAILDQTFSLNENAVNSFAIGNIVATDPEGTSLELSITSGNTSNTFSLNGKTLEVNDSTLLDYENNSSFELEIQASDGILSNSAIITVDIIDINESPMVQEFSFTLDEGSLDGTIVGSINTTDPENNPLTYSIVSGNVDNAFSINNYEEIIVENSSVLKFTTNPEFNLTIKVDDGELNSSSTVKIVLNQITGIDKYSINDVKIYPNPASTTLYLESSSNSTIDYLVEIMNVNGEIVIKKNIRTELDISQLSEGVYILRIINADKPISFKLFKK